LKNTKIISEPKITSKSLENTNIISDPILISKSSENTNIIYESTTNSTYLANKEITSQSTQISITLDSGQNNLKGSPNDVSFYVYIGILINLLISFSTFVLFMCLYRKR
jgi:hypothetical protein